MVKRLMLLAALTLVLSAAFGWIHGPDHAVTTVSADENCGTPVICAGADRTVTSALYVYHEDRYANPVEPDTGEVWEVTAHWRSEDLAYVPDELFPGADCQDCKEFFTAVVTVTVNWDAGSQLWVVSCPSCNSTSGPIRSVSLCPGAGCGSGGIVAHVSNYKLIVDIDNPREFAACQEFLTNDPMSTWLTSVDYELLSVDDGYVLNTGLCTLGSAVSAVTIPGTTTTDYGPYECAFNCSAGGPNIVLGYQ